MVGASRIWTLVNRNLLRAEGGQKNDVDLRLFCCDLSQQASSFVRSTAVCSTTIRRDLLLPILNLYHIISAVTALQAATQLEDGCLLLCVQRDEYLPIDRPVHFASLATGIVCYTAVLLLAITS